MYLLQIQQNTIIMKALCASGNNLHLTVHIMCHKNKKGVGRQYFGLVYP